MADDLNKKIKQITDILGQENLPDNIKGLLSLFAGAGGREEPSQETSEIPVSKEEKAGSRAEPDENVDAVRRIKKVMDRIGTVNDPRINLLAAVKPFLNDKRQKKLDNCIKMLHISRLTKFVEDHDK